MSSNGDQADTQSEHVEGLGEYIELSLFSRIGHNIWMGGCPVDKIPGDTEFIVSLYPWTEYTVPEGVTIIRAWLQDTHEMPDERLLVALARWVSDVRKIGQVVVHCQAGLNRSGLIVALAMMVDGASAEVAIAHLRTARHEMVLCNSTFEEWLLNDAVGALERF